MSLISRKFVLERYAADTIQSEWFFKSPLNRQIPSTALDAGVAVIVAGAKRAALGDNGG